MLTPTETKSVSDLEAISALRKLIMESLRQVVNDAPAASTWQVGDLLTGRILDKFRVEAK